tara:strand:+ start:12100 stop:12936 length:837 start_codon:yes stop_codon:yes gene_type:complete
MSLMQLPEIKAFSEPKGYSWDVPSDALASWSDLSAAENEDPQTITIYDVIGEDDWTGGGFTARRMNAALRSIGPNDVIVKINSPGGSVFEAFAIYNELVQHKAKVTVEIMGIAASAAAYIAMAGDEIKMGLGTFIMVHNAWGGVVGNRNDLTDAIEVLGKIDDAQMDIFEARTGLPREKIEKYMDAETFFTAKEAVENGFADEVIDAPKMDAQAKKSPEINAKRRLEVLLAQTGVPRVERRKMINEATGGKQDAAPAVMHDADLDAAALAQLLSTIRS